MIGLVANPIGLVPKTSEDGQDLPRVAPHNPSSYRFITDLCRSGMNVCIPQDQTQVQYVKFDQVIAHCLEGGPGCYLAKTDIKSAYRIIPIAVSDRCYLCFRFQGRYFVDKCLPFGLATSCRIFERFATAIQEIAKAQINGSKLEHYLDDFIGCDVTESRTNQALRQLTYLCRDLNIPIAWDKMFWATQVLKFLGLVIDTIRQMVFIPDHKTQNLMRKLLHVRDSKTVRVKTLQSLAGSLNFYARAKPGGCTFIRRLYDADQPKNPYHYVNMTSEIKRDLRVWIKLLQDLQSGSPFVELLEVPGEDIRFFTDASGDPKLDWGAYFDGKWAQGHWGEDFITRCQPSTAWLELYALTVAVTMWAEFLTGRRFYVFCDNTAHVQWSINRPRQTDQWRW